MNLLNIKGHSGCVLTILKDDNKNIVRKQTNDIGYIGRLELQANKQSNFRKFFTSDEVIIPEIYNQYRGQNNYHFDMEYFQSLDVINYLENLNISEIITFTNKIIDIIESILNQSKLRKIDKTVLVNKLNEIKSKKIDLIFVEYISELIHKIELIENDIIMPIGLCHGDLTFSNILVQNEKLILIDFLDSFIESPLQDIVKLRQDTKHLWTLNLYEKSFDKTKIKIIMNYIDKIIDQYFQKYDFYVRYYSVVQQINLLRIVPYTKDRKIINYLFNELKKLGEK